MTRWRRYAHTLPALRQARLMALLILLALLLLAPLLCDVVARRVGCC